MKEHCHYHPQNLIAPMGMAILLKRGKENEVLDRLNVNHLSREEKDKMRIGKMAFRHFIYNGYCQDFPISYE